MIIVFFLVVIVCCSFQQSQPILLFGEFLDFDGLLAWTLVFSSTHRLCADQPVMFTSVLYFLLT